ncbi:MAG: DUF3429 domain-containing protein [Gammaproteobacteria bacterium]|nr:DUF3429 domain-containing protein [Gammaproteobacteria bacterium]
MKQFDITLANTLTYSGTLPLIGSVILLVVPMAGLDAALIASTYSAVIISFLCGIHWAAYLFFADRCPRNLLMTSNMVALLAWGSLLAANYVMINQMGTLLLQALCFLYLLVLDWQLHKAGVLADWFIRLRRNATLIVVMCLLILAAGHQSI